MFNPFDFEKDDASFVEATKDSHERDMKISKLSIARNWLLMGLLLQAFFMFAILLLDSRQFLSQSPLQISVFVLNAAGLYHTDMQIKVLKAAR